MILATHLDAPSTQEKNIINKNFGLKGAEKCPSENLSFGGPATLQEEEAFASLRLD